jgi:hypothetical protein
MVKMPSFTVASSPGSHELLAEEDESFEDEHPLKIKAAIATEIIAKYFFPDYFMNYLSDSARLNEGPGRN